MLNSLQSKQTADTKLEGLLLSKYGKTIPVEADITIIKDGKGLAAGMVLVFRDITSRRLALEQIKLQTSRAEALVKVAEQLNSRLDFKEVLDTVCGTTNQILKTSATMILLYDPKSNLFKEMAKQD